MNRCPWTGNPCSCNSVEAFVNCVHSPALPIEIDPDDGVLDFDFDTYGQGAEPNMGWPWS